jgi:arylformamidase
MVDGPKDLFRTRDHVADFDRYVSEYARRSMQSRERHEHRLDVAYGDSPAERLDLFLPQPSARPRPIHLFIHGGYWRMFSKDDFSFIADTVLAAGGIAAIMDYSLMPGVRMQAIVGQVRSAAKWLKTNADSFGGDARRLTVSGHSAGAHLCCTLLEMDSPATPVAALLLSGIYDLAPLQQSFLQPLLGLTDQEVADFSPVTKIYQPATRVTLMVGELETEPFHTQANQLQALMTAHGSTAFLIDAPEQNHMSIVLDMGDAATQVGRALVGMVQSDS